MNTERLDWHVTMHFLDDIPLSNQSMTWQEHVFPVLENLSLDSGAGFKTSFDELIQRVNQQPGGYAEGDGSIGIVGPEGDWKIVGTLYEMQDEIIHVELLGNGPSDILSWLIEALDCQSDQCVVQVLQAGFFIGFDAFQNWNDHLRFPRNRP